jgi:hypothetical protein
VDETLDHLFTYPHPILVAKSKEIIAGLRKKGLKRSVPRAFLDAISTMMTAYFTATPSTPPSHSLLRTALYKQWSIGVNMFLCGFPVTDWLNALRDLGEEHVAWILVWTL